MERELKVKERGSAILALILQLAGNCLTIEATYRRVCPAIIEGVLLVVIQDCDSDSKWNRYDWETILLKPNPQQVHNRIWTKEEAQKVLL